MSNTPIVPAPNTGEPTVFTAADISALVGKVTPTASSIIGYTDTSLHSLNSLVELDYVRVGNEVMAQSLSSLEGQLNATQSSLTALTTLQGLQNDIAVKAKSAIPFTFSNTTQNISYTRTVPGGFTGIVQSTTDTDQGYISAYNLVASAYYQPITPYFSVTMPGQISAVAINVTSSGKLNATQLAAFQYYRGQIMSSKAEISSLIAQLTPLTPNLANGQPDPTTLLAKLKVVYGHMPSGSFSSVRTWILDGYNLHQGSGVQSQGMIQQEITDAINAGESANSSQSNKVRQYMFIFQQYYQSASSIISTLNQIMQDVARKINLT